MAELGIVTSDNLRNVFLILMYKQGQKCAKRRVVQAAIRLGTAVIKFRNKERNVGSPS